MSAKSSRRALLKLALGAGQLALLDKVGLNPLRVGAARADGARVPTKVMTIMVTGGWQPWYFFNPLKLSEVETFLPKPRMSVPLQEPMYCVRSQVEKNLDGTQAVDGASPGAARPLRVPRLWDEANLAATGKDLRQAHPATGLITCPFGYSWAHAPWRLWENAVVVHGIDQGTPAHAAGRIAALCGYAGQAFKDPGIHAVVANAMLDRFPDRPLPAVAIGETLASSRGSLRAEADSIGVRDVSDLATYLSEQNTNAWGGLRGTAAHPELGRLPKPQLTFDGADAGVSPTHPIDDFALAELRRMRGKTNASTDAFLQRLYDGYVSTSKTLAADVVSKVASQVAFEHVSPVPWGFGGEYFGFSSAGSNKAGFGGTEDFALALKLLKADVTSAIAMSLRVPIPAGGGYFDTHGGEDFNWTWQFLVMEMIGRFVAELKQTPASTGGGTMLDETLIMVVSDFSRTWPINGISDHWPITSVVYIGGGILSGNRMIGAYDVSSRPPTSDGFEGVAIDLKDEKGDTQHRAPRAHDTVFSAYRLLGIDRFMSDGPGEIIGLRAGT